MQMNVLRTKQVSHVGRRDDHGQPIAGSILLLLIIIIIIIIIIAKAHSKGTR